MIKSEDFGITLYLNFSPFTYWGWSYPLCASISCLRLLYKIVVRINMIYKILEEWLVHRKYLMHADITVK